MSKVVVLGGGISGHTAALNLRQGLSSAHEVVVVEPKPVYNWIPSNIWVGIGKMHKEDVIFPLKPIYDKMGIVFHQARATEIHPQGDAKSSTPYVVIQHTDGDDSKESIPYDFLINATGPKLNFAATPGLGPEAFTQSVCTHDHAERAALALSECIAKMKAGEKQTLIVGVGHGLCTCEGAAFEYVFNVEFELRRQGVRQNARLIFLTNEAELGDFGVGGMHMKQGGFIISSKTFAESLFVEREIEWITGAHVTKVEANNLYYETLDGEYGEQAFDFAMLLPPFAGVGLKAFGRNGEDLTQELFAPNGLMKVDANYSGKPFEDWHPSDWPNTYRSPSFMNIFAIGIAFAPPHQISFPRKSKNGTPITPAPPRTGMPSATMGRVVAENIVAMIKDPNTSLRTVSMADMGAACVASAGANWRTGSAASMTMYPIVPDFTRYPRFGRSLSLTWGEIGSAGHWIKMILHYAFLYKAKAKLGWRIIPE